MSLRDIEQDFSGIRELNALQFISDQTGMRFSIRGGVVRNILLGYEKWAGKYPSLFGFVDAFADIDLVIENWAAWAPLWQQIATMIPFAEFHRWEPTTGSSIKDPASQVLFHPIDRFRIDFQPKESPRLSGTHIDETDEWERIVEKRPTPFDDKALSKQQWQMRALRLLRYRLQFPDFAEAFLEPDSLVQRTQRPPVIFTTEPKSSNETALSIAVMKLLFNVPAKSLTSEIYSIVAPPEVDIGQDEDQVLIGSVSKNPLTARLDIQLRNFSRQQNRSVGKSFVPLLPIHVLDVPADPCCAYRDFSHDPVVIAWKHNIDFHNLNVPDDIAVVGTYEWTSDLEPSIQSKRSTPPNPVFGLPGIVNRNTSIVARIDASFAAGNAGQVQTLRVGLVDASGDRND